MDILSGIHVPTVNGLIFYFWIAAAVVSCTVKFFMRRVLEKKYMCLLYAPLRQKQYLLILSIIFSISVSIVLYSLYSALLQSIDLDNKLLLATAKFNLILMMFVWCIGPTLSSFWLFLATNSEEVLNNQDEFWRVTRFIMNMEIIFIALSILILLGFISILSLAL